MSENATTKIRQATPKDAATIAPLFDAYRQFYEQAGDLPLALSFITERLKNEESVIFIAEDGHGKAVGFTQLYPSFSSISTHRMWILNDLFVIPSMRGQRVARTLLDAARAHAVATDARHVELSTAHDNPAQKLYESVGYERDRTFLYYSLTLG